MKSGQNEIAGIVDYTDKQPEKVPENVLHDED
jgi:hypothetical protein